VTTADTAPERPIHPPVTSREDPTGVVSPGSAGMAPRPPAERAPVGMTEPWRAVTELSSDGDVDVLGALTMPSEK
jgi:hypothetical protein